MPVAAPIGWWHHLDRSCRGRHGRPGGGARWVDGRIDAHRGACGGRALCEGKLYNAYGEMVASVMQEGLTRYQRDFTPPAR